MTTHMWQWVPSDGPRRAMPYLWPHSPFNDRLLLWPVPRVLIHLRID